MQMYICKCGKRFKKSSTAESTEYKLTGYSAAHECYGCPYIIAHRDWQTQEITKYTCRATQTITYGSCCSIGTADKDYTQRGSYKRVFQRSAQSTYADQLVQNVLSVLFML